MKKRFLLYLSLSVVLICLLLGGCARGGGDVYA